MIEPNGNAWLAGDDPRVLSVRLGLGDWFQALGGTEKLNDNLLGYLEAKDLCLLAATSKVLAMLIHHDVSLWKDLACTYPQALLNERLSKFHSWRSVACGQAFPQSPMDYGRVFSDRVHRSILFASLELRAEWLSLHNVAEETSTLSVDDFVQKYESQGKPVLIRGHQALFQKGLERWRNGLMSGLDTLKGSTQAIRCGPCELSVEPYQHYCQHVSQGDENPLYIFDAKFAEKFPQLEGDYQVPAYFAGPGRDLFAHMSTERRPDYRWVIGGVRYSCSKHHVDPNCTNAWNVSLLYVGPSIAASVTTDTQILVGAENCG